jgi:guanylate kinase
MKKGLLIIISGPSGVGKGTIRQEMMNDRRLNLWYSVSLTTRQKRPGEKEGREYHFVSEKVFEDNLKSGNLLEHARFVDHFYGTPKDQEEKMRSQGKNVILEIDVNGARQVMKKCLEDDPVSIFILPPSMDELEKRIRGRCTEGEKAIEGRLERARIEMEDAKFYTYKVVNDNIDRCVKEIQAIIRKELESQR